MFANLFNFCDPVMKPQIESDKISSDGYEVANLISRRNPGFMTECYSKPPVNVSFEPVCNIDLKYIIIWPTVGSHSSTVFELLSHNSRDYLFPVRYVSICKIVLPYENKNPLVFSCVGPISIDTLPHSLKNSVTENVYPNYKVKNVDKVVIRIQRANTVLALGRVEVWGVPNTHCGKYTRERINKMWSSRNQLPTNLRNTNQSAGNASVDAESKEPTVRLNIPSNFLDEITLEIMSIPMILPSGKVVDQSTIERFQDEQALYGLKPSDPFTGVVFTATNKPAFCASLKATIELFLLKNNSDAQVQNLKRTAGVRHSHIHAYYSGQKNARTSSLVKDSHDMASSSVGAIRIAENATSVVECNLDEEIKPTDIVRNNENFSKSIDDILKSTLTNMPSFLHDRKDERDENYSHLLSCSSCNSRNNLYKLLCAHYICRLCAIDKSPSIKSCAHCSGLFSLKDIVKVHT